MTYRAVYDFSSEHKNILSFKTGDLFVLVHRETRGDHDHHGWIYVANENVKHGYVPATYVALCEENEEVKNFITELTVKCEQAKTNAENEQELKRCDKLLKQLINYHSYYAKHQEENHNTLENGSVNYNDAHKSNGVAENGTGEDDTSIPTPASQPTPDIAAPIQNSVAVLNAEVVVPELFGCDLLEHVKLNTGLGYKQVRMAVESTLDFLSSHVKGFKKTSDAVLDSIKGSTPSGEALENIHDWQRLGCIFSTILAVKTDVEQLNWALHEDQHIITEFLEELISILTDGDPVVCKLFLQKDHYNNVEALVQYFQMETRTNIRQLLLKVFVALCSLDRQSIQVLVNTDLPLLLAKDILSSQDDVVKLTQSCSILTMLFWTGDEMPVNHYDTLSVEFVNHLLEIMDELSTSIDTEKITNSGTELILAFNLQFSHPETNIVLQALKSRSTAKEFLEKLIMLANREDDPVGALFDHSQPPTNSVHKMLLDIFSQCETSDLFYTNDLKVLIEIIARKLMDLSPEDETQAVYLLLANNVICNTNYSEHGHCADEFQECFQKILLEESGSPESSKNLVKSMMEKFPGLFND